MKRFYYAIYQPLGIMESPNDELHRFSTPAERDRWVNTDLIHRKTVLRKHYSDRHELVSMVFSHVEREQMWDLVDSHEVFVGISSAAKDIVRPSAKPPMPSGRSLRVRGDGTAQSYAVSADREYEVLWLTTPNDTAIVISGVSAAIFTGRIESDEFHGFVRAMLADSKYDRLIEGRKWLEYHDSIRIAEGLALVA